ncbi:MAG: hypothetical protein E5Y30_15550 [Mesorhizobium sp.]|uniref:hypothetical protein n=1 Tax=Mesorhizobium sp. M7A.F.Ca.MR.176.00.0.0 TaxID=2496776 RepID=UPI000FD5478A|nr:hypothetical protein [Mesorhizobium sp. M7A.F.Ca.MR.176.00.0.0]RUU91869.1 hypothetical protein EOB59_09850 [Mesorhizobium sp. M7A.F.Ca.MR.176.00.0.0]TIN70545.1 MAG: hypothetical protein E5Y30_15550 [Mesorhizobium sp.]TIU41517.1 MAG: hypothetical protein E5W26_05780 [Mesorhizobium sp.]
MNNTVRALAATALICILAGSTLFLRAPDYFTLGTNDIVSASPLVNNKPAGEFTKGFVLDQPLVINQATDALISNLDQVCIEPLLATYVRPNSGKMRISLTASQWSTTGVFDFKNSPNNDYAMICQDVKHESTGVQNPVLRIESLEGENGSSITAWLTQDTSRGSAAINGRQTNMSLVFTISKRADLAHRVNLQNILVLIYLMATAVLMLSALRRNNAP